MRFMMDFTGTIPGTLPDLLTKLLATLGSLPSLTILTYVGQLGNERSRLTNNISVVEISPSENVSEKRLALLSQPAPAKETVVGSFRPEVWALQYQPTSQGSARLFLQWNAFLSRIRQHVAGDSTSPFTLSTQSVEWPEAVIPIEEALELLTTVLWRRGGRANKTQLRPALSEANPKLSKSNPDASDSRIISILVERAVSRGIVRLENAAFADPHVVLIAPPNSPTIKAPIQAQQLVATQPFTQPLPQSQTAQTSAAKRDRAYLDPYTEFLETYKMGPFANLRPHFYKALEDHVPEGLTLESLVSKCMTDVRSAYSASSNVERPLSWQTVRRFFERLLEHGKVLVGDKEQPIWPSFEHGRETVRSLSLDWQSKLEGVLVIFLLEHVKQIDFSDMRHLTGALYMTRSDEDREKLFEVISHLRGAGKIIYEGSYFKLAQN